MSIHTTPDVSVRSEEGINQWPVVDMGVDKMCPTNHLCLSAFRDLGRWVDDKELHDHVLRGVEFGFDTYYEGRPEVALDFSVPLSNLAEADIRKAVQKGIARGYMLGPFKRPPFPSVDYPVAQPHVIKVFTIPKNKWTPEDGKKRAVFDRTIDGVNDLTPRMSAAHVSKEFSRPPYSLRRLLSSIASAGPGARLEGLDISWAYKRGILRRGCWHQQCVKLGSAEYYVDTSGLFGSVAAGDNWDCLMQFANMGLRSKYSLYHLDACVDNVFNIVKADSKCFIGILVKEFSALFGKGSVHEVFGPSFHLERYLGVRLDLRNRVVSLPHDKSKLILRLIEMRLGVESSPVGQVRSFNGLIAFVGEILPVFMKLIASSFKAVAAALRSGVFSVRRTRELTASLKFFRYTLGNWNGTSLMSSSDWSKGPTKTLWGDACCNKASSWGRGVWNQVSGVFYAAQWNQSVRDMAFRGKTETSTFLEQYAAVEAILSFGVRGDRICYYGDCKPMIAVANKGYSKNPHIMALLGRLFHFCAMEGVSVRFVFVPGKYNVLADHLSRGRIQEFIQTAPKVSYRMTPPGITPLWL